MPGQVGEIVIQRMMMAAENRAATHGGGAEPASRCSKGVDTPPPLLVCRISIEL